MSNNPVSADGNLLFGLLALQMDFINRDQLIAGMQAWVLKKELPLVEHLVQAGALSYADRGLLEPLVQAHIHRHNSDPQQSLAAIGSAGAIKDELAAIVDEQLEASLQFIPQARPIDPGATITTGQETSFGARFRILRPHARGGLGEVFVAKDAELNREVALKEIQRRYADDTNSRSRFTREAEITGRLEHPGIVPVYGLGAYPDGRPFYAMRFIRGQSLKETITSFHESATTGSNGAKLSQQNLALRRLLQRFIDVCEAIDYAHNRGVLHRDLKPGNIMLGRYGETLVVDWGLAKAMKERDPSATPRVSTSQIEGESTDFVDPQLLPSDQHGSEPTQLGSALGTPAYMSPEQAQGRIDLLSPASDVFSLGATLYSILTGKPPYSGSDSSEVLRQATVGKFPPPSALQRGIPPGLESICLKAMAFDPAQRYPSAKGLGEEIEQWLADEPISARRDSLLERMGRWIRRHQTLAAATASTGAVILIAGIIFGVVVGGYTRSLATANSTINQRNSELTSANSQLTAAKQVADAKRIEAEEARQLAEDRFQEKRSALDEILNQFSDTRLKMMPGAQEVREVFLEKAIELYVDLQKDDPTARSALAEAHRELGLLQGELGDTQVAHEQLQRSIDYHRQMAVSGRVADLRRLGEALFTQGQFYWEQQQSAEARAPIEECVQVYEKLLAENPDDPHVKLGLGRALTRWASLDTQVDPTTTLKRAQELLASSLEKLPDDVDAIVSYARVLNNRAITLPPEQRRGEEGMQAFELARRTAQRAFALLPTSSIAHSNYLAALTNQADGLELNGKPEQALELFQQAVNDAKQFALANPAVLQAHQAQARQQLALARLLQRMSRFDAAVAVYEDVARVNASLAQSNPRNVAAYREQINAYRAIFEVEKGREKKFQAAAALDRALAVAEDALQLHPDDDLLVANVMQVVTLRGNLERDREKPQEALNFYLKGLDWYETTQAKRQQTQPAGEELLIRYFECGDQAVRMLRDLKQSEQAIQTAEQVLTITAPVQSSDIKQQQHALLGTIARVWEEQGRNEECIQTWLRALEKVQALIEKEPQNYYVRSNLIGCYWQLMHAYQRTNDLEKEFAARRDYLAISGYLDDVDHSALLQETETYSEQNLQRLRDASQTEAGKGSIVRLTVPIKFDGVPTPFFLYVTKSYQPVVDQFRWVEEVRGGVVAPELKASFRQLAEIAKANKVSYVDLVVYALGTAAAQGGGTSDPATNSRQQEINSVREQIKALTEQPVKTENRILLATYRTRLAELYFELQSFDLASQFLPEAESLIPLDESGEPFDQSYFPLLARTRFLRGLLEAREGRWERAFGTLLEVIHWNKSASVSNRTLLQSAQSKLGEVCAKLDRPSEAVDWYWKSIDNGNTAAIRPLAELILKDRRLIAIIDSSFAVRIREIEQEIPPVWREEEFANRLEAAWQEYSAALRLVTRKNPDGSPGYTPEEEIRSRTQRGSYLLAWGQIEDELKKHPDDAGLLAAKGFYYARRKQWNEAALAYKASFAKDRESAKAPAVLAHYLEALLLSGEAPQVLALTKRMEESGWKPVGADGSEKSWQNVFWSLRAMALVVTNEDPLPVLEKIKGNHAEAQVAWNWNTIRDWSVSPKLNEEVRASLAKLLEQITDKTSE